MARTLNGNHTGRAAHGQDELYDTSLEPNDQDKRIIALKRKLRDIMGDDFNAFYAQRPLNGDLQERYFSGRLEAEISRKETTMIGRTGTCGYKITNECEAFPCQGCDVIQRLYLPDFDKLEQLVQEVPPEPLDWPWTKEDWLSELENRRPETTF